MWDFEIYRVSFLGICGCKERETSCGLGSNCWSWRHCLLFEQEVVLDGLVIHDC